MKLQLPLRWIETLVVAIARALRDFNRRGTGTRSLPFKRIIFSILVLHAVRSTAILGLVLVRTCESFQSARITREQSVQPRRSNSALKLPANFSLPAERETGKSRRKKRYEAVRYEAFAPFPRYVQCSILCWWSSTIARWTSLGATDYRARCIRPIRECYYCESVRFRCARRIFSTIQDVASTR